MKPLDGILVIDFSRVLAGPMSTQILADFGARVVKIERQGTGDETRAWEPRLARDSGYFFAFNRGKESLTLDLKSDQGRAIAKRLALKADILVENFPVGQMASFGLGAPELRALNPRLVYVSNTGFGQTGPSAHKVGYDTVFQAMGGLMSLTGERDGPPVKAGLPMADLTSALWLAIAALTGLAGRAASGKGCHIDVSMMDVQVSLLTIAAARFFATGEVPERQGTEHPGRVPSAAYRCRDGHWLQISASDQHWAPLCKFLGLGALAADPKLAANAERVKRRAEITAALTAAIACIDRADLLQGLEKLRVPAGPINDVAQVLADPHTVAREMVGSFDYPGVGAFPALRNPLLFDGHENPTIASPPVLGADSDRVLTEILEMPAAEIARLRGDGVI
jgi:crotonobetainyl-CoA:carnitine CoA-transferase CaiB-like acyl-CoA transferase